MIILENRRSTAGIPEALFAAEGLEPIGDRSPLCSGGNER